MKKKRKRIIVGIPKEIKAREGRVGLTPEAVREIRENDVKVLVQAGAGFLSGFSDRDYRAAGAVIVKDAAGVYGRADMIVKVKEPLPPEYDLLREKQAIFTYLHPAANPDMVWVFIRKRIVGVSYDLVQTDHGQLPLLRPMSVVAGMLAIDKGREIRPMAKNVVIVGAGVAGCAALIRACKSGLAVKIFDTNEEKLAAVKKAFSEYKVWAIRSTQSSIINNLRGTDILVGAVLKTGGTAPKVITREMLKLLAKGTVVVDISIDQGGCFETSRATTHDEPTFEVDGIIHYCVANMPGCVPEISTPNLIEATLPYLLEMLKRGLEPAKILTWSKALKRGVVTVNGRLTNEQVSRDLMIPYVSLHKAING